jgi:hypothetical protein
MQHSCRASRQASKYKLYVCTRADCSMHCLRMHACFTLQCYMNQYITMWTSQFYFMGIIRLVFRYTFMDSMLPSESNRPVKPPPKSSNRIEKPIASACDRCEKQDKFHANSSKLVTCFVGIACLRKMSSATSNKIHTYVISALLLKSMLLFLQQCNSIVKVLYLMSYVPDQIHP